MAVVTGTPWDLALEQTEHAGAPATSAAQGTSPRSAYQSALYQRAHLVDIRSAADRVVQGQIPSVLAHSVIDVAQLITWLVQCGDARPTIVISDDGEQAAGIARALSEVRLATVAYVQGGFAAWQCAGLPVD